MKCCGELKILHPVLLFWLVLIKIIVAAVFYIVLGMALVIHFDISLQVLVSVHEDILVYKLHLPLQCEM